MLKTSCDIYILRLNKTFFHCKKRHLHFSGTNWRKTAKRCTVSPKFYHDDLCLFHSLYLKLFNFNKKICYDIIVFHLKDKCSFCSKFSRIAWGAYCVRIILERSVFRLSNNTTVCTCLTKKHKHCRGSILLSRYFCATHPNICTTTTTTDQHNNNNNTNNIYYF